MQNNKILPFMVISGTALFVFGLLISCRIILAEQLGRYALLIDFPLLIMSLIIIHRYLRKIKSMKISKFMLTVGIALAIVGIFIPYGIVIERHGYRSDIASMWLMMLSIIYIYPYYKIRDKENTFIFMAFMIFFFTMIINNMDSQDINDSMAKKGAVRIVARVIDLSSGSAQHITYEFAVDGRSRINKGTHSRDATSKLRIGDTIIITYSVDNPTFMYFYEVYPNRKLIEKYKYGVYVDPKKYKEKRDKTIIRRLLRLK
jgi:hypothetical protein